MHVILWLTLQQTNMSPSGLVPLFYCNYSVVIHGGIVKLLRRFAHSYHQGVAFMTIPTLALYMVPILERDLAAKIIFDNVEARLSSASVARDSARIVLILSAVMWSLVVRIE